MAKRTDLPPAAVCTVCGLFSYKAEVINQPCRESYNRRRCKGAFGSALSENDWVKCLNCKGSGCALCQKSGWDFIRPQ